MTYSPWSCSRPECNRPFRATFTHDDKTKEALCKSHYESERQKQKRRAVARCTVANCKQTALVGPGVLMQLCLGHHMWVFHSDEHSPYFIPLTDCACDLRAQTG